MLLKRALFSSLLAFNALAAVQEATAPEDSDVVRLDEDTIVDFINDNDLVMVEFYAPWCGHCKRLAPEYIKAATMLKEKYDIPIGQINCEENKEFCASQGIRGYPTLKVFKNHEMPSNIDYFGARTAEAIVNYMYRQSLPSVSLIKKQSDLESVLANSTVPVVVNYSDDEEFNSTFNKVADKHFDGFSFISFPSGKKQSKSDLSIYLVNETQPISYTAGDVSELAKDQQLLEQWLAVQKLPYFGEINGGNFDAYMASGLPLAYFFYSNEQELQEFAAFFRELSIENRGLMNFVSLDAEKFGRHAKNLNMKEQFPLFVIHNITANKKYGVKQMSDEEFEEFTEAGKNITLSETEVSQLVKDFLSGEAEPIVKTEEIPDHQDSNVTKIVGKNHDEVVYNPKVDVLVKYYAPWCGHCKRLAPIYEQVADILQSDKKLKDKVILADLDHEANDVDGVDIKGYPTIILYPAKKGAKPIQFEGMRSIEGFLSFLKENTANKIDGYPAYEKYKARLEAEKEAAAKAEKDSTAAAAGGAHDEL